MVKTKVCCRMRGYDKLCTPWTLSKSREVTVPKATRNYGNLAIGFVGHTR